MKKVLTVKDVAEQYGYPRRTIYFWLNNRMLPHEKIGTRVFIRLEDIEKFKHEHYINPNEQ